MQNRANRNPWVPFYTPRAYFHKAAAYIQKVIPVIKQKLNVIFVPVKVFFSPLVHLAFYYVFPFLERYGHVIIVIAILSVICYFLVKVIIFLQDDLIPLYKAVRDTIDEIEKYIKDFFN